MSPPVSPGKHHPGSKSNAFVNFATAWNLLSLWWFSAAAAAAAAGELGEEGSVSNEVQATRERSESTGPSARRSHVSVGWRRRALVYVYVHAASAQTRVRRWHQRVAVDSRVGGLPHQPPAASSHRRPAVSAGRADSPRQRLLHHTHRPRVYFRRINKEFSQETIM